MDKQRVMAALDAVKKAQGILTDAQAAECSDLYPDWDGNGKEYVIGERVLYEGVLYKVNQTHTSQPNWTPASEPALYARVLSGQSGEVGVFEKPTAQNPYMKGARVHFPTASDPVYECLYDNNVFSPAEWPQGWKVVD